ncbi:hypothetical protein HMPREF3036_01695 [Sutterella sp. KLE1602]|nr:hypothetical protein HMPREF3036_01695 [Sutterella sp. KLE1602]
MLRLPAEPRPQGRLSGHLARTPARRGVLRQSVIHGSDIMLGNPAAVVRAQIRCL